MPDYIDNLETQIESDARDIDVSISVATGGTPGQTLSTRAALGQQRGAWGWCLVCAFLSLVVQKDHCRVILDPNAPPSPVSVYWRSAVAFLLVAGVLVWLVRLVLVV